MSRSEILMVILCIAMIGCGVRAAEESELSTGVGGPVRTPTLGWTDTIRVTGATDTLLLPPIPPAMLRVFSLGNGGWLVADLPGHTVTSYSRDGAVNWRWRSRPPDDGSPSASLGWVDLTDGDSVLVVHLDAGRMVLLSPEGVQLEEHPLRLNLPYVGWQTDGHLLFLRGHAAPSADGLYRDSAEVIAWNAVGGPDRVVSVVLDDPIEVRGESWRIPPGAPRSLVAGRGDVFVHGAGDDSVLTVRDRRGQILVRIKLEPVGTIRSDSLWQDGVDAAAERESSLAPGHPAFALESGETWPDPYPEDMPVPLFDRLRLAPGYITIRREAGAYGETWLLLRCDGGTVGQLVLSDGQMLAQVTRADLTAMGWSGNQLVARRFPVPAGGAAPACGGSLP